MQCLKELHHADTYGRNIAGDAGNRQALIVILKFWQMGSGPDAPAPDRDRGRHSALPGPACCDERHSQIWRRSRMGRDPENEPAFLQRADPDAVGEAGVPGTGEG